MFDTGLKKNTLTIQHPGTSIQDLFATSITLDIKPLAQTETAVW